MGLGEYVGGRLRLDGAKQPLHIRDHAVVFDGRKLHSSGLFNGDRWSLVLLVHSPWEHVTPAMRKQLTGLGLPCPPQGATLVAVPAVEDAVPSQEGLPSDDADVADDGAVPDGEPADDAVTVRDPKPKAPDDSPPEEPFLRRLL